MESGREDNAATSAFKDDKSHSFDYIPSAKEAKALTLMPEHSGEFRGTSVRRYLQQEKSVVYVATPPQKTKIGNAVGEELLEDNQKHSVSGEQTSFAAKQRRRGVVQVSTEQRHRKNAIAENKQSAHERTFLRVLHKKF